MGRAERAAGMPDPVGRQSNFDMDEDLFNGYQAPPSRPRGGSYQEPVAKVKNPPRDKAVVAKEKALTTRRAVDRRRRFESRESAPGGRMADARTNLGTRATNAQIYMARGWGEAPQSETGHPQHYDRQIPGLEDPTAAPQNKRWEEHTPEEQAKIAARVKMRTGHTVESMTHAYGAQLDQAYLHAEASGVARHPDGSLRPPGQDFYTSGEPVQVIRQTAHDHGVPMGLVAAMHADNSPNTKFKSAGEYPQDRMVRAALSHVQSGGDPDKPVRPERAQGYGVNFVKSSRRAGQVLNEGVPIPETTMGGGGGHGLGPKTAAYMNSWLRSTPDQFVADVHSGGGGMLPHLGAEKPVLRDVHGEPKLDSLGKPKRDKSEREHGIETTGIHAMMDYASRQALAHRGLGSTRQAQAAQWAEERHQRGMTPAHQEPPHDEKMPVNPNQFTLF